MTAALRYIITRPCLSEGTLTVAKYLRTLFSADLAGQTLHLTDEQERDYPVQMSENAKQLTGLSSLYHDHNLDVNDVLMLSPVSEGRYRVSCVIKPHTDRLNAALATKPDPAPRRVVINATPHVREVRMERSQPSAAQAAVTESRRPDQSKEEQRLIKTTDLPESKAVQVHAESVHTEPARRDSGVKVGVGRHAGPSGEPQASSQTPSERAAEPKRSETKRPEPLRPSASGAAPKSVSSAAPELAALETLADQLGELARLTGYQVEYLGGAEAGPVRLRADLGSHGYDMVLALSEAEQQHPAFQQSTYRALLTWEKDLSTASPRFTREALGALLEHARLAPLTPVDLRGYWNTSSFDLDSVASLAELVSAHLVQRGTFSYVLATLAQQPAHSIVDPSRLAERLGSGVNTAELRSILETLCRAPFMALLPLPGGQFYLRSDVPTLLAELSEYAQGVSKRLSPSRVRA
ncbi:hypothetical protein EHF33_10730 [Deinococcus psychrotolerans]|uniref:Uncharacterized protein n=1 Tax=Deinococcus psychrotolerans TaxID=2489213 RepID=A0A3G8YDZ6_9DEIO|nr:hypothetical protein [Deinococcus psychrotolerans]AZI43153.1 hypothetical protein EHF33_10730 [Deinococcus psychrotolerans]